eukprot:TRINITY_DN866_c1_g1_i2.p1 TRINITY_DN866_c1_g1~~TRINITY_DN866_c1_g1_i2.p1  ORF type:complete len:706 (+),score=136.38 TRINITY_DN866_c1_g1_i2:78-2195(+)
MPKLILWGRTWMVGTDDFVFPGIRGFVINCAIAVWIPLIFNLGSDDCGQGVKEYLWASFALHCTNAVLCLALAFTSGRGGILQTSKRKMVPTLLITICISTLVVLGVTVWGLLELLRHDACNDHPEDRHWLMGTAIVQVTLVTCTLCVMVLDYNCSNDVLDPAECEGNLDEYNSMWKTRCKRAFCFVKDADENLFEEIAKVMAGIFSGLDFVVSDIAAGMALLHAYQIAVIKKAQKNANLRTDEGKAKGHPSISLSHEARPIKELSDQAENDLLILHQFSGYFMGAYGWPLHIYANPMSWMGKLCGSCCKGLPSRDVVHDDNCCKCNSAAWMAETKADKENLLYSSWVSKIDRPAFYICVDHDANAVILGIRGTLAPEDYLTDANAGVMPFGEGLVEGGQCHKGIGLAARGVRRAAEGLLAEAFTKYPEYRLIILGHSLGAGTAALLSIELKSKYPNLLGLAYSPPGGLMNKVLRDHSQGYILALGFGKDIVPRASINTVRNFRDRMLETFAHSETPKCKILGCCCFSSDTKEKAWFNLEQAEERMREPYNETRNQIEAYLRSIQTICEPTVQLYPPSRYIHIMRVGKQGSTEILHPISMNVEDLMDEGILASTSMVFDHFPHTVMRAINKVVDPNKRYPLNGFGMPSTYVNPLKTSFTPNAVQAEPLQPRRVREAQHPAQDITHESDAESLNMPKADKAASDNV